MPAILATTFMSASCGKMQETGYLCPITFKAEAGVSLMTKSGSPLKDQVTTFKLYGAKTVSPSPETVFDGFTMNYADDAWNYKGVNGQEIQYWDFKAENYRFSAATDDFVVDSGTARIEGASSSDSDNFLALENYNTVPKSEFGEPVELQFSRLLSRISVAFYEDMEDWEVKNINFSLDGKFVNQGDYAVNLQDGTFAASNVSFIDPPGIGGTVSVSDPIGTTVETATASTFTNILPYNSSERITLTINSCTYIDSEHNEYVFYPGMRIDIPASKAQWDLNHSYTYIVKISDSEVILDMIIDLSIHDWMPESNETILE
ncbi:MAG: fimbrillin family protein [Bacteroidales bacterium]|nr:fimbrillin family protein [Bacteroidales bacterium]